MILPGENRLARSWFNQQFNLVAGTKSVRVYSIKISTQIKEAENELMESEKRFHTMADNISQLAWMANADGKRFWFNRRYFEYTGTTLEEIRGWGWLRSQHPEPSSPSSRNTRKRSRRASSGRTHTH